MSVGAAQAQAKEHARQRAERCGEGEDGAPPDRIDRETAEALKGERGSCQNGEDGGTE